jgi:MoxR-like ATPase
MTGVGDAGLVREAGSLLGAARAEMGKRIVGKDSLVRGILLGVTASGHVLLEGVPGLAKTLAARTFADISGLQFSRVQFTPDLLPADITGSVVYEQATGRFATRTGPLFAGVVLADEVNRAPAKVQSALLEAMEEGQVTIGESTMRLPDPFFVLATQNPIEHEGTYPLPEAQLDRFLLKVLASYPGAAEEAAIVAGSDGRSGLPVARVLGAAEIGLVRRAAASVAVDPAIVEYLVRLTRATRPETGPGAEAGGREVGRWIEFGASPRASIHLYRASRAFALLDGRGSVLPEDVKAVAPEVLRHRLVLSYLAEADGIGADEVIGKILGAVPLP